jgi:hypothetical protein
MIKWKSFINLMIFSSRCRAGKNLYNTVIMGDKVNARLVAHGFEASSTYSAFHSRSQIWLLLAL